MVVRYIQHGNHKQCIDNGVEGYEFSFAQQTPDTRLKYGTGGRRWLSRNKGRAFQSWNLSPEYAMPFRLELKYENQFLADDIPF